jgi:glycosyltransferase involved in cell wall biosynthesis
MTGLFNDEDQELLRRTASLPNVYARFERIPDSGSFNGLVSQFDVFFAAYLDFPNSSNTIAKAALYRRPIIVGDGYLMAERVREYSLGEVIPEGDAAEAELAIRRLLMKRDGFGIEKGRKAYLRQHSLEALRAALLQFIRAVPCAQMYKRERPC